MKTNNSVKNKWIIVIGFIASVISLVLSVWAICRCYYRTSNLEFDYLGVIVGVLAILVTCLVAWNIYTLIDLNAKVKSIQDEQSGFMISLDDRVNSISKRVFHTQAGIHQTAASFEEQILNPRKDNISTRIIIDMIATIDALSKADKYEEANIDLEYYSQTIVENTNAIKNGFDRGLSKGILGMLYDIPNRNKLSSFEKFEKQVLDIIGIS